MRSPAPVLALALTALLVGSCGGDGSDPLTPDPVPDPPPVASVTLGVSSVSLEVGEEVAVTAVLRDSSGAVLTDRTVTWSSSDPGVVAVSGSGNLRAEAPGEADVTASSEGRSASVSVTVQPDAEGTEVGPEGGSVVVADGAVRIDVPAGAVSSATFFGAGVSSNELEDPDGTWLVGGPAYTLHPGGQTFDEPVTVTLRYDPDALPGWVDPAALGLHRWDGTAWHPLDDVDVDPDAGTVTGTTSGFSDVGVVVDLPTITISPGSNHVNDIQRWVGLVAEVDEVGSELWYNFTYEWATTGQSGELLNQEGNSTEYLATKTVMTTGEELDEVTVTVMAQRVQSDEESTPPEPVGTASVIVRADLDYAIEFLPTFGSAEFGETEELLLVIRDRNGNQVQDQLEGLHFTWSESGFHGSVELPLETRTRTNPATYQANPLEQQEYPAPRVDQITVLLEQRYRVYAGTAFNPNQFEFRFRELATVDAFVRVHVPDPLPGRFTSVTQQTGGGACVSAYFEVPHIEGATLYEMIATDFGDTSDPFGGTFTKSWSGATDGVTRHGDQWRIYLEGGCATNQFAIDFRRNLYRDRYGNARVEVTVTEPESDRP